jgi:hypothetical protein
MNVRHVEDLGIGRRTKVTESIYGRRLEEVNWNPVAQEGSGGYLNQYNLRL